MPDPLPPPSAPAEPDGAGESAERSSAHSRHFRVARPPAEDARAEAPAPENEIESLTRELDELVAQKKARDEGEQPEGEPRARRERMTRSGSVSGPAVPSQTPAPEEDESAPGSAGESDAPAIAPPLAPVAPSVPHSSVYFGDAYPPPPKAGPLVWVLGGLAVAVFAIGFFLGGVNGRASATAREAAESPQAPPPGQWKESTVDALDRALTADRAGDLPNALRIAKELKTSDPNLPGLDLYLAELKIRADESAPLEAELSAMIAAGQTPAQAFYLRAFNCARQRSYADVAKLLHASLVLDPFQADTLFQTGELLRRQGKFTEAITVFRQALLRVRPGYGIAPDTIAFKLRLALIEAGNVDEVFGATTDALAISPPAPEWLLTAAALALQKNEVVTAVQWLDKAKGVMDKEEFQARVDDYYFRKQTASGTLQAYRLTDAERALRRATSWEFFIDP